MTRGAVESLRHLLEPGSAAVESEIRYRRVEAIEAIAISEVIDLRDALTWHQGALAELNATIGAQGARICGACGGIFATELFADERGQAIIYAAFDGDVRLIGRLIEIVVPAAELATVMRLGSHDNFDLAHGALATHMAQHAIAIDEPIREYRLAGPPDVRHKTAWRTEVGWPVFHTASA